MAMARRGDLPLVLLAAAHGAVLWAAPVAVTVALGVWWNSNTVAHNFVHRPFFRARALNAAFALYQTLLLGIPQTLWRQRHLAHHADTPWRLRWSSGLVVELLLVVGLWITLATFDPLFFATVYAPGYVAGLGLCAMQGHYEHAGAVTTSHYGRVYNLICFNDGYHREHHAFPGVHWTELPGRASGDGRVSRWPALLRWLDTISLAGLERLVLRSPALQRAMVACHAGAMRAVLPPDARIQRVAIVGGGLFPRTALVLRQVLPGAALVVIDRCDEHLATARAFLEQMPAGERPRIEYRCEKFEPTAPLDGFDLIVIPLDFDGPRQTLYDEPPARYVLVHDWIWRRGTAAASAVVSPLLLKRVALVVR